MFYPVNVIFKRKVTEALVKSLEDGLSGSHSLHITDVKSHSIALLSNERMTADFWNLINHYLKVNHLTILQYEEDPNSNSYFVIVGENPRSEMQHVTNDRLKKLF